MLKHLIFDGKNHQDSNDISVCEGDTATQPGSLSQELWAKPLKMTLGTWLTVMAPKNLMRLKAHLVDGWMVGRLDVAASFQGQPGNGMKWL